MAPPLPPKVQELFNAIKGNTRNVLREFFNIFVWKGSGDECVFIEDKGEGDKTKYNESSWVNSTISARVKPERPIRVHYDDVI
jgi:hypothetical protein